MSNKQSKYKPREPITYSLIASFLKSAWPPVIVASGTLVALTQLYFSTSISFGLYLGISCVAITLVTSLYQFLDTRQESFAAKEIKSMKLKTAKDRGLITPDEYLVLSKKISEAAALDTPPIAVKLVYFFNAKLFSAVTTKLLRRKLAKGGEIGVVNPTVVGLMADHKSKQNTAAYVTIILAIAAYIGFSLAFGSEVSIAPVAVMVGLIFSIYLSQWALHYRIDHDLYGTNEAEARELIGFILRHADSSQFTGSDGSRVQLLPDPKAEVERLAETAGNWGEVPA